MAASTGLTLRQRRLGRELRKLRERADLTSTAAAGLLGGPQARISNIEAGRYAVSSERVRTLAQHYSCCDEQLIDALVDMTGGRSRGWWEEYRDLLPPAMVDVAELEHHATALRVAVVVAMPGLLQTLDHARATFRQLVPPLRPHEIEHRASFRIKRQAVLHAVSAMPYTAIIHESVLRMGYGGRDVTRDQLCHLLEMSEQPRVTVRVIPFGEAGFPASGQPISYAHGPISQLDTVVLDTDHGCDFIDAEPQLVKYRTVLDRMEACALGSSKSRDLIRQIVQSS